MSDNGEDPGEEAVKLDDDGAPGDLPPLHQQQRWFPYQIELGSLLCSLDLKPSLDHLEALINKTDTNSNGIIKFSEFVTHVTLDLLPEKSPYIEDQLRQLFNMFD